LQTIFALFELNPISPYDFILIHYQLTIDSTNHKSVN